jgi:hypothetical protein
MLQRSDLHDLILRSLWLFFEVPSQMAKHVDHPLKVLEPLAKSLQIGLGNFFFSGSFL